MERMKNWTFKIKLGRPSIMVQIYKIMLNYKCKSQRGHSNNNTDLLCILEVRNVITNAFATLISDKKIVQ